MDLSKITDISQLKALAYDMLVNKETAETNLRAINQRILELQTPIEEKSDKKK